MLILGIDPSSTRIGVALVEYLDSGVTLLKCESFKVNHDGDTLIDRIDEIDDVLSAFLRKVVPPRTVYIERPVIGPLASRQGIITQCACFGAIIATVRGVHPRSVVEEIGASEVKKLFTGKGNATKDDVAQSVIARFNITPANHDAADAVAIAVAGYEKGALTC